MTVYIEPTTSRFFILQHICLMFEHVCIYPPCASHRFLQSKVTKSDKPNVQTMHQVYLYIMLYTRIYQCIAPDNVTIEFATTAWLALAATPPPAAAAAAVTPPLPPPPPCRLRLVRHRQQKPQKSVKELTCCSLKRVSFG